jgi:Protein of unknown function (DUF2889)
VSPRPEPRRGGEPSLSTPARRPRSVRRTTTHDCTRPDGISGPVALAARGRDLLTDDGGRGAVVAAVRIDLRAEFSSGIIEELATDPADPRLASLVGVSLLSRFRDAVEAALPGETMSHTVRNQLFDDLPMAVMMSGRVLRVAGIPIEMARARTLPTDICAGWATGGTLLAGYTELGPPLHIGPTAPTLEHADDPLGWHPIEPLPPRATRRRRRLDAWEEDGVGHLDCFFRDSYVDADGSETVVHEWRVAAQVDPVTEEFVRCDADMGPLPYPECPNAAASAQRLVGAPFDGLRRSVRTTFVGPTTCTHLNDTLRVMQDAGALLATLRGASDD